jgi:hypothetical protein
MGGQIVEDDADALGLGEVNVRQFAHTHGEVDRSPAEDLPVLRAPIQPVKTSAQGY